MTTARFLLGSGPSQLFLSFVSAVGAVASSAFRVFASLTYAVRYVRRPFLRSAYCYASSLPASPATGYSLRSVAPASFGYVPKASTRPAHAARTNHCGGVCTAPASSPRHTPTSSEYEKREALPPPFGVLIPTLPTRPQRFRAWTNPTLSPLPSPGDRRSERTECGRLRPEPRHHHAGEQESRSVGGRHRE